MEKVVYGCIYIFALSLDILWGIIWEIARGLSDTYIYSPCVQAWGGGLGNSPTHRPPPTSSPWPGVVGWEISQPPNPESPNPCVHPRIPVYTLESTVYTRIPV